MVQGPQLLSENGTPRGHSYVHTDTVRPSRLRTNRTRGLNHNRCIPTGTTTRLRLQSPVFFSPFL